MYTQSIYIDLSCEECLTGENLKFSPVDF